MEPRTVPTSTDAPRYDAGLVRAFAEMVLQPGRVMLIAPDNKSAGRVELDEAIASGQAFAGTVFNDILAVDCDDGDLDEPWLLNEQLREEGFEPIIVASGQPGRLHLFCRVTDPDALTAYKGLVKSLGFGSAFEVRSVIRPPLSPHRLGFAVDLVDPDDPAEALAMLTPPAATRAAIPRHRRPLPERIEHLLDHGQDRSAAIQAAACSAIQRRWTEEEFASRVMASHAGGKLRGRRDAQKELARAWVKAAEFVAARPAKGSTVRDQIDPLQAALAAYAWTGRTGSRNRVVMGALVAIAAQAGTLTISPGVRRVAEQAGVGRDAAHKAIRRLAILGWLTRQDPDCTHHADKAPPHPRHQPAALALHAPGNPPSTPPAPPDEARTSPPLRGREGRCPAFVDEPGHNVRGDRGLGDPGLDVWRGPRREDRCPAFVEDPGHDVWRYRGLGKGSWRLWRTLDPLESRSDAELATLLGWLTPRGKPNVRRARYYRGRLAKYSLVVPDDEDREQGRWLRGHTNLDQLARALGTAGAGRKQRRLHAFERKEFDNMEAVRRRANEEWRVAQLQATEQTLPADNEIPPLSEDDLNRMEAQSPTLRR